MFKRSVAISLLIFTSSSLASYQKAKYIFDNGKKNEKYYKITNYLVEGGYYFSALPLFKEYLGIGAKNLDSRTERNLSKMIRVSGLRQFESLPSSYLTRSNSENTHYILAKKYIHAGKYESAMGYLRRISSNHSIYPYAKNLEGVTYSINGDYAKAMDSFRECISASSSDLIRQNLNRDYCIAGLARTSFASKKYNQSDLLYLDIPKSSRVWPEILFEEAWNSYYQKNYNRTLGKLVSYKAPVFAHIFNPEVEVLNALTYLKLCLYQDAKKVSDSFRAENWDSFKEMSQLIKYKKNPEYFYELALSYEQFNKAPNQLLLKIFGSITNAEPYLDLKVQLKKALLEYKKVRAKDSSRFKNFLVKNLQESVSSYKNLIGFFVMGQMRQTYGQLYKAFEGMSYINLEVLAQRKAKLYNTDDTSRSRGDIKYIQRNEKQYFWDFNGEFWADELGDYVFALKSEC